MAFVSSNFKFLKEQMKKPKFWAILALLYFMVMLALGVFGQQQATVDKTQRKVLLYENGTWVYDEIQKKQSEPKKQSLPVKHRCEATTKKGTQCKLYTPANEQFCHIHKNQSNEQTTKAGPNSPSKENN